MGFSQDETLTGVLERIIFSSEETAYCIGEFRAEDHNAPITIAGTLPNVQCGETLSISGHWLVHPKHGQQFKINSFKSKLPSSVYGIRKYLGSGLVPGIGKVYADKIVAKFGEETFNVISHESARLKTVPGIGAQRAKSIKEAWDSQQAMREVMMFLKTYGVSTAQCVRLVKIYGNQAKVILENNPYRIAQDISGIGFKTADKIALNLGFSSDSPSRIDAGILFALSELEGEGHSCVPLGPLVSESCKLLDVEQPKVEARIQILTDEALLHNLPKNKGLQSPALNQAEHNIAKCINKIHTTPSILPSIIIDKAIEWAQARAGFDFAPEQSAGLEAALSSKLSVLTGGPGTGKTTILKALVDILRAKKVQIQLAAPTGRAAQRMSEATGLTAQTIHRLLKFEPGAGGFTHNKKNPLKTDFLIVDEASMLDTKLTASLLEAIPSKAHILFVGDIHQLPSIGPGHVLKDFIRSSPFKVCELNQIFRQQNRSNIVTTSHEILNGVCKAPESSSFTNLNPDDDLHFIQCTEPEECLETILDLYQNKLPKWYGENIHKHTQILAPMHKGSAGIGCLNTLLQDKTNPKRAKFVYGGMTYYTQDKIIQNRNNYDKNIFNGDLGCIDKIDAENASLKVDFDCGPVELERSDMSDISLAYAISIHKSQGSEFPIVIIPILKQHFIMLKRNLVYTAITRGRKKVFIIGDPAAYAMAIRNKESTQRNTNLKETIEAKLTVATAA